MRSRLRLFDTVVTPSAAREQKLRTTQRKMLRGIIGVSRRQLDIDHVNELEGEQSDSEETGNTGAAESDDAEEDGAKVGEPWVEWIQRRMLQRRCKSQIG